MLHEPQSCRSPANASQCRVACNVAQRWWTGHENVVRPPTVRRSSGAPSFGQCAPGSRCEVRSPVCEPPRRRGSAACRGSPGAAAAISSSVEVVGGASGIDAGPPERLVAEQVAEAGDARLVHEHRLHRRPAPGGDRAQLREREHERVGTEAVLVGIELDRAEAARVAQVHGAAVGERHAEAVPRGIRPCCWRRAAGHPRLRRRSARGRSCRGAGPRTAPSTTCRPG